MSYNLNFTWFRNSLALWFAYLQGANPVIVNWITLQVG